MIATTPPLFVKGGIPNSLVRSAIFTTRKLGNVREMIKNSPVFSQDGYSIEYTGERLNQFDSQTLYAILQTQRDSGLLFGNQVTVTQTSIIEMLGKEANGNNYKDMCDSIHRLYNASIGIKQSFGGSTRVYHGRIIDRYLKDSRGHISFTLNPDLAAFFDSDCTILSLKKKIQLSKE